MFAASKFRIMDNYNIVGIQQLGIGTVNINDARKWYADMFQMNIKVLEDDMSTDLMKPYTHNQIQKMHTCITLNLQGGGGFETLQFTEREPQRASSDTQIGDLGIFMAKIKSHNIADYHEELSLKYKNISAIFTDPRGLPTFYIYDPFGNCFQVVEDNYVFLDEDILCGGVVGVMIGVSDIDRSLPLYKDILGYDTVIYDKTGIFNDWQTLKGGSGQFRRILLGHSSHPSGPFAGLYGNGTIELVQVLDREPRKIYEGRLWGDPGFSQICFDVVNLPALEVFCESRGYKFTLNSGAQYAPFNMGQVSGHFAFMEDADGTLIEFVEAEKIPLINRLDFCINLQKRNQNKQLPELLFYLMKLNKVNFK